jgi:purine-nucleoside phosphorylase
MPFSDHINLGLPNPLASDQSEDGGAHFMDIVDLYEPTWRDALLVSRPELTPGVYAGLSGPSYETPAEVFRLQQMGADAVGMSTIPEALAAKSAGARVMALSMMTNYAAGIGGSRPSHAEVLETAAEHGSTAAEVLAATIQAAPR